MADRKQTRAEAVRQAVDDAFQTAAGQAQATLQTAAGQAELGRGRAQELVDELSGAAGRLRDVLEELRPPTADDLRDLRLEVRALSERLARLESAQAQASATRPPARGRGPGGPKSGAGSKGAKRPSTGKPPSGGGAAKGAKRPSTGKPPSGGGAAKGAGRRRSPKG